MTSGVIKYEAVVHAHAHVAPNNAERVHAAVDAVWAACGAVLGATDPVGGLPTELDGGTVAARQDRDHHCQVFLRSEDHTLTLSLLVSRPGVAWDGLDALLNAVLDGHDVFFGVDRLYIGQCEGSPTTHPAPLRRTTGWSVLGGSLRVCEGDTADDARTIRRLVVLAHPHDDDLLGDWVWVRRESDWEARASRLPPLARYLRNAAKIRYQLRVHRGSVSVTELCHRLDAAVNATSADPTASARLAPAWSAVRRRIGRGDTMRRAVRIAEANAVGVTSAAECFPADRAVARSFADRLGDDIAYLRTADRAADRLLALLRNLVPIDLPPTFAVVAVDPEEFAAARVLLDKPRVAAVASDRAVYYLGAVPSLDRARPHRVVLSMLGDTGPGAAADACANLARSFPEVNYVILIGTATGVPGRGVRLGDVVVATDGVVDHADPGARMPLPSPQLRHLAKLLRAEALVGERPWDEWARRGGAALPGFGRPGPQPATEIHHGRIASADGEVVDPAVRDAISDAYGVLAIEREATGVGRAGFSNGLQWFAVRGIATHGDGGPDWRSHAALSATAYAFALIATCPPLTPRGGHNIPPMP